MSDVPPGAVCVPCTEQMWSKSAWALIQLAHNAPDGTAIWSFPTTTMLAAKRNRGVHRALEHREREFEWILHLDSDMTPPPDVVHRLWATAEETGADAVSPLMVQRTPPYMVVGARVLERGEPEDPLRPYTSDPDIQPAFFSAKAVRDADRPFEVDIAGTGCLLVRRRVYERLDAPWFVARETGGTSDFNATLRMTDAGCSIVLHPDIKVGHVSSYSLDVEDGLRAQEDTLMKFGEKAGAVVDPRKGSE